MDDNDMIAKITDTYLGVESHGIFTAVLTLDYGSSGQGTPGYALDGPLVKDGERIGRWGIPQGVDFIKAVIRAAGVEKWEDVKGRTVIATIGEDRQVSGIRPLPTENGAPMVFREIFDNPIYHDRSVTPPK